MSRQDGHVVLTDSTAFSLDKLDVLICIVVLPFVLRITRDTENDLGLRGHIIKHTVVDKSMWLVTIYCLRDRGAPV